MTDIKCWWMYDNHTFRRILYLDEVAECLALDSYGTLFSRSSGCEGAHLHARGDRVKFLHELRERYREFGLVVDP